MTAAEIAAVLGDARRQGRVWRCRCPLHGGRSLVLSDGENGRVLATCWGGCDRRQVIRELQSRGLWGKNLGQEIVERRKVVEREPDPDDAKRTQTALAMWESARPAQGTPVEAYLASRGIDLPVPDALRFHVGLKHPTGSVWPAMVALVTNGATGTAVAVHRTFIVRNGKGKAPVNPQKMMLGPVRGAAVRLGTPQADRPLAVSEGLETGLSVMVACGIPVWAALSANGIRALVLPPVAREVIIIADHDANGIGESAARDAALQWRQEGREVRIAMPPEPGTDFADVLLATESAEVRDVG